MNALSAKKALALVLGLSLLLALPGCSGPSGAASSQPAASSPAAGPAAQGTGSGYPDKPIELIVPVAAGGDTDVNGRIFAKYLTEELGQSVVIVNMGGAGGSVGTQELMNSPADGYRILWYHNSTILNQITGVSDISYNDLEVADIPLLDQTAILVARADSGWKDLTDMAEYAKANPGKITVGMETATLAHLVPLTLQDKLGVEFNIVDIGAANARLTGLLGGQIDMFFAQYGLVKDYIATGEFVALCALSEERNPAYDTVPTAKELGCDLSFDKFFYFAFPKGTPQEVADVFNQAVQKVIENPELQKEFENLYLSPSYHDKEQALAIMDETQSFYSQYQEMLK